MATTPEIVADVREFNRFNTRVVGLLRPDLAASQFGLTEARVLFEVSHSNGATASDLRRELGLDAGYLRRILGSFTTAGLVDRGRCGADGRRQIIRLTDAWHRAFADLDRLQVEAIHALLAPLDESCRQELVTSMGRVRRALDGPPTHGRGHSSPDTAQLRLLFVEPSARGLGIGTRLVDECLRFAKRAG